MSCLPLIGSFRLSPRSSSRRSGRFIISPRLATRLAGRRRLRCDCGVLSFLILISCRLSRLHVLACLGAFLSRPMMWMAAGGWRSVESAGCLLACSAVVSVPFRLSSLCRSISWLVRLVRLGFVVLMQWRGFGFGGCHAMPCVIPSSPIVFGRLRRAC